VASDEDDGELDSVDEDFDDLVVETTAGAWRPTLLIVVPLSLLLLIGWPRNSSVTEMNPSAITKMNAASSATGFQTGRPPGHRASAREG
jgi:hypothetical protein